MAEEKAPEKKPSDKKSAQKTKRSSALKRDLQSQKRRLSNRSFRATVLTAVRGLEAAISQKEGKEALQKRLGAIYSLMDKGVKKGVYKAQKAARTKSRLSIKSSL